MSREGKLGCKEPTKFLPDPKLSQLADLGLCLGAELLFLSGCHLSTFSTTRGPLLTYQQDTGRDQLFLPSCLKNRERGRASIRPSQSRCASHVLIADLARRLAKSRKRTGPAARWPRASRAPGVQTRKMRLLQLQPLRRGSMPRSTRRKACSMWMCRRFVL